MQYKCSILYVRQISLCSAMHICPYFNFRFYFHVLSFCFCAMIGVCVEKSLRGRNAHLSAAQKAAPIEVTQKLRNKSWQIHKYTFSQLRSLKNSETNPGKYTNTLSSNRGHSDTPQQILESTQIHFWPIKVHIMKEGDSTSIQLSI